MLLDARPDRIDFRDREFRPRLQSLPPSYPPQEQLGLFLDRYAKEEMILDQGAEGACTGFGLAAVVNYLNWQRAAHDHWRDRHITSPTNLPPPPEKVSQWMLYNAARAYDEWEGEDYSGSSCRGAMKGWHKHGVCADSFWPKGGAQSVVTQGDWTQNAARRPLGAYYRIDIDAISDVQAAIHEVGAVYCSARVHDGWFFEEHRQAPDRVRFRAIIEGEDKTCVIPQIPLSQNRRGGHAFALVGYTARGFILQNSWGARWGKVWGAQETPLPDAAGGFALISYEDWVLNAHDAWVATFGAPMLVDGAARARKTKSRDSLLEQIAAGNAARARGSTRWPEDVARDHCIVMGNDGKLMTERIDAETARGGLRLTMQELLDAHEGRDVVIFAHGGLNTKEDAFRRAQVLGPWFKANNILPIFIVWRTGFGETLANIGRDFVQGHFPGLMRSEDSGIEAFFNRMADGLRRRADRGFEVVAEKVMGKAVWSQMKQNAEAANMHDSNRGLTGGMRELADFLKDYQKKAETPLRIHLLGHSAGSIILGHFAQDLARFTPITSLGLLAPACTLKFANAVFAPLVEKGHLQAERFYIANLSRENERADHVGPYNKSLLYLVSRAFEVPRKTPLLGLDDSWILDCEWVLDPDKNARGESFPRIHKGFDGKDDPFHQAMLLAKLAPYYALTGRKPLTDFDHEEQLKILAEATTLQDTDPLRAAAEVLEKQKKLKRIAAKDGIMDVMRWRNFKAQHNFPYQLHSYPNAKVRETEIRKKKFEPIAHGNIDNDIHIMNWALAHMISGDLTLATDLSET